MFLKIFSRSAGVAPFSATTSDSLCTSFIKRLDALVVDLLQVVEDEHVVHDLLRQVVVGLADEVEHRGLDRAAQHVEDLGRRLGAAERGLAQLSPPASTLPMTSLRSCSAPGWMPSSVAMRTMTSLRWRSPKSLSTAPAGRRPGAPGSRPRSAGARCAAARPPSRRPSTSGSRCRRRRCPAGCGRSAGRPCPRPAPCAARP